MPYPVTPAVWEAITGLHTDKHFVAVVTLSHPSLEAPIRAVSDTVPLTISGTVFEAFPFQFERLSDGEATPRAAIAVQNVDRRIGKAIKLLTGPMDVQLDVVIRQEPTVPIISFKFLKLRNVTVDGAAVRGELGVKTYTTTMATGRRVTRERAPALWV